MSWTCGRSQVLLLPPPHPSPLPPDHLRGGKPCLILSSLRTHRKKGTREGQMSSNSNIQMHSFVLGKECRDWWWRWQGGMKRRTDVPAFRAWRKARRGEGSFLYFRSGKSAEIRDLRKRNCSPGRSGKRVSVQGVTYADATKLCKQALVVWLLLPSLYGWGNGTGASLVLTSSWTHRHLFQPLL